MSGLCAVDLDGPGMTMGCANGADTLPDML
jgi:hypothetical protein